MHLVLCSLQLDGGGVVSSNTCWTDTDSTSQPVVVRSAGAETNLGPTAFSISMQDDNPAVSPVSSLCFLWVITGVLTVRQSAPICQVGAPRTRDGAWLSADMWRLQVGGTYVGQIQISFTCSYYLPPQSLRPG